MKNKFKVGQIIKRKLTPKTINIGLITYIDENNGKCHYKILNTNSKWARKGHPEFFRYTEKINYEETEILAEGPAARILFGDKE